jgi:hypothetical protein
MYLKEFVCAGDKPTGLTQNIIKIELSLFIAYKYEKAKAGLF